MKIFEALPALGHRDFRIFWFGQMVSLTGTWVQTVAQQWLVLNLTHSAFKLGLVTTVQFTPLLLLSLLGGAIADRFSKRDLLLATQVTSAVLALLLGILVKTGSVRYWQVLVIAAALGTVNAIYTPARQAFVPELVNRESLLNAVALNSTVFNGARVVGPAVGGVLIATIGLSLNFFINAASYVAVILSLLLIARRPARPGVANQNIWGNVIEGLRYIVSTPVIYTILAMIGVASLFGLNFTTLTPLFARDILHVGSGGYGLLTASMGLGSLAGAVSLAFFGRRSMARGFIFTGVIVFSLSEIAFAFSRMFWLSMLLLVLVGIFMTLFTTTSNTTVLSLTPPGLQGRVMSVYSLMFLGVTPFGSIVAGYLAERFGAPVAVIAGACVTLVFTFGVLAYRPIARAESRSQDVAEIRRS